MQTVGLTEENIKFSLRQILKVGFPWWSCRNVLGMLPQSLEVKSKYAVMR